LSSAFPKAVANFFRLGDALAVERFALATAFEWHLSLAAAFLPAAFTFAAAHDATGSFAARTVAAATASARARPSAMPICLQFLVMFPPP
jgi:hypothetical protein